MPQSALAKPNDLAGAAEQQVICPELLLPLDTTGSKCLVF
jgi:hypothetical protein